MEVDMHRKYNVHGICEKRNSWKMVGGSYLKLTFKMSRICRWIKKIINSLNNMLWSFEKVSFFFVTLRGKLGLRPPNY